MIKEYKGWLIFKNKTDIYYTLESPEGYIQENLTLTEILTKLATI